MDLQEYQEFTKTTVVFDENRAAEYLFPALASEAGELCEVHAKGVRDNWPVAKYKTNIVKEAGDVLWMLSNILNHNNLSFEEVIQQNVEKLSDRAARDELHGSGDNR